MTDDQLPAGAKSSSTSPRHHRRTRAEVMQARRTPGGCCYRHADNSECACLDECGSRCERCWGFGLLGDNVSTCPDCHGTGEGGWSQ